MMKSNIIENKGTHFHSCYVTGHRYECGEDCECICGLPMNGNDHSDCPVELRPCPEHKDEQEEQPMADEASAEGAVETISIPDLNAPRSHCECGCKDIDASEIVGWCLHCDHVYAHYTPKIENRHFALHCPGAPLGLKQYAAARINLPGGTRPN